MRRKLAISAAMSVAAGMLAAPLVAQTPATADGIVTLPLELFSDILVDQARGHVFMTGGPTSTSILVTNLDGALQTPIPNAHGASQMLLSQDGTKVYVGLAEG